MLIYKRLRIELEKQHQSFCSRLQQQRALAQHNQERWEKAESPQKRREGKNSFHHSQCRTECIKTPGERTRRNVVTVKNNFKKSEEEKLKYKHTGL